MKTQMRYKFLCVFVFLWVMELPVYCQHPPKTSVQLITSLDTIRYHNKTIAKNNSKVFRIRVQNQLDFDKINENIIAAINNGEKNIIVNISSGIYYFKENHINLYQKKTDASITIKGHKTIVVAADNKVNEESGFNPYTSYVDIKNVTAYNCWGEMQFADSLIQVVDKKNKICRLHCSTFNDAAANNCKDAYVDITQWYKTISYHVREIKNGWLYFIADNLDFVESNNYKDYNVNNDYIYGKEIPRFRLCNVPENGKNTYSSDGEVIQKKGGLHECKASCFLSINSSTLNTFTMTGIRFVGNKRGNPFLCLIWSKSNRITIKDCSFESLFGRVAYISNTSNVIFDRNKVINCYENGICVDNDSENISVTNCVFERCGWIMDYSFCIQCEGKNYYIANNIFRDFSYGAINTGIGRGNKRNMCSGIIENNQFYYTDSFFKNKQKYTIMDSGVIQLASQHGNTIIRYNYIHDYVGMKDNRGIFCDEGARNLKIYNNVIINIPNCYSIDSRRVNRGEQDSLNNTGNVIMYNIVDGEIRFVGREGVGNGCVKIGNVLLNKNAKTPIKHQYDQLEQCEDDITIECKSFSKDGLVLDNKNEWKMLKKIPGFKHIKKYIKVKR